MGISTRRAPRLSLDTVSFWTESDLAMKPYERFSFLPGPGTDLDGAAASYGSRLSRNNAVNPWDRAVDHLR